MRVLMITQGLPKLLDSAPAIMLIYKTFCMEELRWKTKKASWK
jgi:hypothetical protein